LDPIEEEIIDGQAEVKAIFEISKLGKIAGSIMKSGSVNRNSLVRVLRGKSVIVDTKVSSLKKQKDDVREVTSGHECGIGLELIDKVQVGDILQIYHKVSKQKTIEL
jgi:translation initiation factor IF-2